MSKITIKIKEKHLKRVLSAAVSVCQALQENGDEKKAAELAKSAKKLIPKDACKCEECNPQTAAKESQDLPAPVLAAIDALKKQDMVPASIVKVTLPNQAADVAQTETNKQKGD